MRCSEVSSRVAALRECKDITKATQLHQEAIKRGHFSNKYVVSSLINMYSRLGNMHLARQVFDESFRLQESNVVAWTVLMMGYVDNGESLSALELFHVMQEQAGCSPNSRAFLAAIKACTALAAKERQDTSCWLELGRALHSQAVDNLCCNIFIETALVDHYSKSGSMALAQRTFDGMSTRNVVSWTALLQGYVDNGQFELSLELFGELEQAGVTPDARIYVVALRACSSLAARDKLKPESSGRWLDKGRDIHSQAVVSKSVNIFVASSLIDMYGTCGCMTDARRVFDSVARPDVVCWNSLLQGYAESEHSSCSALELFNVMVEQGSCVPDSRTYVAVLSACTTIGTGRCIHSRAASAGCVEVFVEGSLVQMYSRCGRMNQAQLVFDSMSSRSGVSWTALLRGYVDNGQSLMALKVFASSGSLRSAGTYLAALMACATLAEGEDGSCERERWLVIGKTVHSLVLEDTSNVCMESALVDMYSRCGRMVEASLVFDSMSSPDIVSWNALLHGYVRNGEPDPAMKLYRRMTGQGIGNARTVVAALSACATLTARKEGRDIYSRVLRQPEEFRNGFVDNTLIDMYSKCGCMVHAQLAFDCMESPDVVSWTALAMGYVHNERNEQALEVLVKMRASGTQRNSLTFVAALEACGNLMALETGREFHAAAAGTCGLEGDGMVANSLVSFYGKCGRMDLASEVFESMTCRKSVVSWTALMCGYCSQGDMSRVFEVVERMREQGVEPSEVTFVCLLAACSQSGLVDKAMEYFEGMLSSVASRESPGIRHYNCIIDMLGRGKFTGEAMKLVRDMPVRPNAVTWTTILSSCESVPIGRDVFQSLLKLDEKDGAAHVLMSNIHRV